MTYRNVSPGIVRNRTMPGELQKKHPANGALMLSCISARPPDDLLKA